MRIRRPGKGAVLPSNPQPTLLAEEAVNARHNRRGTNGTLDECRYYFYYEQGFDEWIKDTEAAFLKSIFSYMILFLLRSQDHAVAMVAIQ